MDEGALREWVDEQAIRGLVARYSDAVCRRDEAAWAATWCETGVWDVGIAKAEGREAVVSTWARLMDHFERVVQLAQQGCIELEGDEARGSWHLLELGWPASGGAGTLTVGRYDDRYRRTADGWRFLERRFRALYMGPGDLSARPLAARD